MRVRNTLVFTLSTFLMFGCAQTRGGGSGLPGLATQAQALGGSIGNLAAEYLASGIPNPNNDMLSRAGNFATQAAELHGALQPFYEQNGAVGPLLTALTSVGRLKTTALIDSSDPIHRQVGFQNFLSSGSSVSAAATRLLENP